MTVRPKMGSVSRSHCASFGEPLLDFSGRMPYRVLQTLYDGLFPKGRDRCYWKSTYLKSLDDEVIDEITARLAKRPPR